MRHTDIAIAGGGLAGSLAAAMLGRAGISTILIDPHGRYAPELRCEKLDGGQVGLLEKTGLADPVLRAATHDREAWVARLGRVVEKRPGDQWGILYDDLVNTIRDQIRPEDRFIAGKVTGISTSDDLQQVSVSTGESLSARLVVVANGLNVGLRTQLGMTRRELSPSHSVTVGFDMKPLNARAFQFGALTLYPERLAARLAYLTLFPIGETMRANLLVYRDPRDGWFRELRESPEAVLVAALPSLRKIAGSFEVVGPIKLRPADLYQTEGFLRAGVVLVGDAFSTSCPAAGTGVSKVFTDVERLCNAYIPAWLEGEGMGAQKIAAFYDDEAKKACDARSLAKAFHLRALSVEPGWWWRAQRWLRFVARFGIGTARQLALRPTRQHPLLQPHD